MKRRVSVLFLPLLILPLACGCSVRGSGLAISENATVIESPQSGVQARPAGPDARVSPVEGRVITDTAGKTDTATPVPAPGPSLLAAEKPYAEKSRIMLNVQFDTNMDVIQDAYMDELAGFARVMKNHPDLKVTIEGHTDNVGGAEVNLELSRRRAERVKSCLVSEGIHPSRIAAQGYGQSRPIADNGTEEGKQKNRRVEAAVEYEKAIFLKKVKNTTPAFP